MSDEVPPDAGRRYAADLRDIREARGVSIEALHDETKIPRGLLDSFESTGLFDHPMFNRVYLRSFVRTYAEVVGIPPMPVLAGLEQALDGSYDGALGREFLGRGADPSDAEDADAGASDESPAPDTSVAPPAPPKRTAGPSDDVSDEVPDAPARSTPPPAPQKPPARPAEPTRASSPASTPRPDRRASHTPTGETPRRQWIAVAAVGVVLVLAAWFVIGYIGGEDDEDAAADPVAAEAPAPDSAAARTTPAAPPPVQAAPTVGDSIDVAVISTGEPVRRLRVTVDDDVRRPYWIEAGQQQAFSAASRLVIEDAPPDGTAGQLDRIRLEVEGRAFPTDRRDEQGRIVLTRETLDAFFSASQ